MAPPNFIVGIGGSAGGLAAYKGLLDALSPRTGMAFVIVAHLLPTASSELAEILAIIYLTY
jgi:two-component system CheB/CheR fusion protein